MANGWEGGERSGRFAAFLAVGGVSGALVSAILAAATGPPYLEADGVNVWIVVFAAALMIALVAFPFGLEVALRARRPDRDQRWELTLVIWGAASAALLGVGWLAGFDTETLGGALGLIAAIESAIVVATVVVWLVAGG